MLMFRRRQYILFGLIGGLLLLPMSVQALGLGPLQLHSALGQRLKADVELLDVQSGDLGNLKVRLSIRSFQDSADTQAGNFSYQLVTRNGQHFIRLVSTVPIREPMLDFLVEVQWPQGELKRELAIFLDPPKSVVDSSVRHAVTQPAAARQQPAAVAHHDSASKVRHYTVQRGDTLWAIARRFRQSGVSTRQLMVSIHKANPDAFGNRQLNSLLAGASLRIPLVGEGSPVARAAHHDQPSSSGHARAEAAAVQPEVRLLPADTTAMVTAALPGAGTTRQSNGYVLNVAALGNPGAGFRVAHGEAGREILSARGLAPTKRSGQSQLGVAGTPAMPQVAGGDDSVKSAETRPVATTAPDLEAMAATTSKPDTDRVTKQPPAPSAASPMSSRQATRDQAHAAAPSPLTLHLADRPAAGRGLDLVGLLIGFQNDPVATLRLLWLQPLVLQATGGLLALLLLMLVILHRRRLVRDRAAQERLTQLMAGDDAASAGRESLRVSLPPSPAAVRSSRLERVDFLLAAGSFREAENLVRLALAEDPGNPDLGVKLLTVYYRAGDRERFARIASVLHDRLHGDRANRHWQLVRQMGETLCPDNPLFGSADNAVTAPIEPPAAVDSAQPAPSPSAAASDAGTVPAKPVTKAEVIDFPVNPPEPAAASRGAGGGNAVPPKHDDTELLQRLRDLHGLGDDIGTEPDQAVVDPPEGAERAGNPATLDSEQFRYLMRKNSEALQQTMGLSEATALKLELARASLDMRDPIRARQLLEEVLANGPQPQQERARQLLRRLQ